MRRIFVAVVLLGQAFLPLASWARCPDTAVPELELMKVGELRSAYCNANEYINFYEKLSRVYDEYERVRGQRAVQLGQLELEAELVRDREPL